MAIIDELLPAEFKGVSFPALSAETPAGVKFVKHTYPNSSNQTIEVLGLKQRTYNLTAVLSGEDYKQRRDRLLLALEEGTPGTLIHPLYGALSNIVAADWSPIEDFTRLGEYRVNIVFEVDTGTISPTQTQNTVSIINQGNSAVNDALNTDIADNYSVTQSFVQNFLDAIDQGNQIIDAFNDNTSFLAVAADQIDLFSQEISDFSNNLTTLIRNPQRLADSISNLFETVNGLYTTADGTLTVFKRFFDFGDDDPVINTTTVARTERKNNRDILRSAIQLSALTYSYLNASQIEFTNINELNDTATELDEQYEKVIELEGLTDQTRSELTDLRVEVQQFFKEQQLTINRVISVFTPETSTRLLSYQYYGTDGNAAIIQDLNDLTDVSFIAGNLDIITE